MEGPRAPHESELPRVVEFLNQTLRPESSWSITTEYPTALTKTNLHNMRICTEADRILSHAVLKPLIVRTPHVVLKVGAIGSVVTDETHRGQGLSTQIIQSCLQEARLQGCDIAVLWTQLHDFYRKLGFELAGFEESFVIEKPLQIEPQPLTMKRSSQIAPEAILRLYQKHTVQTHRTVDEIRKFMQIPQTQIYTAWDKNGQLEAFAVEGKGADLPDYIHEWSGSVPALFALFNSILEYKKKSFVLMTPKHSLQLIRALNAQGVFHHEGFLGMIRIVNAPALLSKIERAFKSLGHAGPDLKKLDEAQLTRVLFGPWDDSIRVILDEQTRALDVLPLRFWLWGWDSI